MILRITRIFYGWDGLQLIKLAWFESLVGIVNMYILLIAFFDGKPKKLLSMILFVFLYIPAAVTSVLFYDTSIELVSLIFCFIAEFVIPFTSITQISAGKKGYMILTYLGFSSMWTSIILWIAQVLKTSENLTTALNIATSILLLVICVLLAKWGTSSKPFGQFDWLSGKVKMFLLFLIFFGVVLASLVPFVFSKYPNISELVVVEMLVAISIIIVCAMFPIIIVAKITSAYFKSSSENMAKQLQAQVNHYHQMNSANKDLRRFKHDFDNMNIGLKKALYDNNFSDAREYLHTFEQRMTTEYSLFKTGNHVADALLSEKNEIAKSINTTIAFEGIIPDFPNTYVDLCVIFGNALDNALEACAKLSHTQSKIIDIKTEYKNRFFYVCIKNPVGNKPEITDNRIETSKKSDRKNHGIGLISIDKAVRKYDGKLQIRTADGIFVLEVDMDFNLVDCGDNNKSRMPIRQ